MQGIENPDVRVPDTESARLEFREIQISKEVEATYDPIETGGEVKYSNSSIRELWHLVLALILRYQEGLWLGLEKQIPTPPKGHGLLFAWSPNGSCLRTSTSRARL